MGICFFCPNGHPLNVKAELAGRIGLCPKCRVKMRIPLQSMRKIDEKEYHGQPTAEMIPDDHKREENSPSSLEGSQTPRETNVPNSSSLSNPSSPTSELISRATGKSTRNIRERHYDESFELEDSAMLLNDPDALWYVITPDNQRYGPAQGSVLRTWIKERRVGPRTRVLRSGWQSALEAGQIFPELVKIFENDEEFADDMADEAAETFEGVSFGDQASFTDARKSLDELRKSQRRAVGALCLIGFLTFVLLCAVGTLIWILLRQ